MKKWKFLDLYNDEVRCQHHHYKCHDSNKYFYQLKYFRWKYFWRKTLVNECRKDEGLWKLEISWNMLSGGQTMKLILVCSTISSSSSSWESWDTILRFRQVSTCQVTRHIVSTINSREEFQIIIWIEVVRKLCRQLNISSSRSITQNVL